MPGASPCGRTNMRIRGWLGRADQTTKINGMFVHPAQVADIAQAPSRARPRAARRCGAMASRTRMTLQAECATRRPGLAESHRRDAAAVTKLRGEVELVAPGSLPNDGKVIADERSNS